MPSTRSVDTADVLRSTAVAVRRRMLVRVSVVHAMGALAVFTYLQELHPTDVFGVPGVPDVVAVGIAWLAAFPLAWLWTSRHFSRTAGWALAGRRPNEAERAAVLEEPWRMAARPFLLWLAAAGASALGSATVRSLPATVVADLAQIGAIGGLATCGLSYLVIEHTFRPLFAHALAGEAPLVQTSLGIRKRVLLAWAVGSGAPLLGLALAPVRETGTSLQAIAILATIGLAAGAFSLLLAAHSIAVPLGGLREALDRVGRGDLTRGVTVDDGGEVGQVQAGLNEMVEGLRERQRLQDLFGRHVGVEVAAQALERGTGLGGEQHRATVVFVDIIGSTAMAEVLPPGEVVATLNAFFQAVVDTVSAEGGWVNKFEGDGALCVFGVPAFQPDHEARALRAARRLRDRMRLLRDDHPGLDAGIGVSSGLVVAGNVGTEERYEYTVIGRAVNEAARLTDLAKQRPERVLASASTISRSGVESDNWTDRGRVGLRGQQVPTVIYEPRAMPVTAPVPVVD